MKATLRSHTSPVLCAYLVSDTLIYNRITRNSSSVKSGITAVKTYYCREPESKTVLLTKTELVNAKGFPSNICLMKTQSKNEAT